MTTTIAALPHRYRPGSARAALSYRGFRLIWLGLFASNIGTWMQNFTLPAYIEHRTESATLVGLLVFTQLGPLLLLSIPAGVLADKVPRVPFLVAMQSLQMAFSVVLAILVATGQPLWTLFATSLVIGIGNAMNAPAFQASVPLLVERADLAGAVSLNSVMMNGSRVLGPVLAAVLALAGFTTAHLFLVNAATYPFLIAALLVVQIPDARGHHPEQGWRRLLTGVNIARRRRVLSRALITMTIFSGVSLVFIGLFPSVARRNPRGDRPNAAGARFARAGNELLCSFMVQSKLAVSGGVNGGPANTVIGGTRPHAGNLISGAGRGNGLVIHCDVDLVR